MNVAPLTITLNVEIPILRELIQVLEANVAAIDDLKTASGEIGAAVSALGTTLAITVERVMARLDNAARTDVTIGEVTQQIRDDVAPLQAMSAQLQALQNDPAIVGIPTSGTGLDGLETPPPAPTDTNTPAETPTEPAPVDPNTGQPVEPAPAPETPAEPTPEPVPVEPVPEQPQ